MEYIFSRTPDAGGENDGMQNSEEKTEPMAICHPSSLERLATGETQEIYRFLETPRPTPTRLSGHEGSFEDRT
jgi:hypothetical protein